MIGTPRGWIREHPLLAIGIVAAAARILVAIGVNLLSGGILFPDEATYSGMAANVVNDATQGWDEFTTNLYNRTATFSLPLTILYWLFWPTPLVGQLLAAAWGTLVAVMTTKAALPVIGRRWAIVAGLIVALLPSQVLFSSLTLKDAAVWATLVAIAVAVAHAARCITWGRLLLTELAIIGLFLVLAHLRLHTLVVASWALALAAWAGPSNQRIQRGIAGVIIAITVPALIGLGPAGVDLARSAEKLNRIRVANAFGASTAFVDAPEAAPDQASVDALIAEASKQEDLAEAAQEEAAAKGVAAKKAVEQADTAAEKRIAAARRRAALLARKRARAAARQADLARQRALEAQRLAAQAAAQPGVGEEEGWVDVSLRRLPKGLLVMTVEPFPWQIRGNQRVLWAAIENIVWWPVVALAAIGLVTSVRRWRAIAFPLLAGGGALLLYSLAEGNFGTAYRHRGEFVWVIALLAAIGAKNLYEKRRARTHG